MGIAFAVLLAIPNLLTLGIVLGVGNAAHAGDRILDVEAPAFRGASLAGALIAVGLAASSLSHDVSRARARDAERTDRALHPTLERVAGVRALALDPAREPALPLLGRAVRPALGSDRPCVRSWMRSSPIACGGAERLLDVARVISSMRPVLERVPDPDSRVAVGLELDAHGAALRAGVPAAARVGARR